jgi:hypothetical protein
MWMSASDLQRPKRLVICDGPLKSHTRIDERLRQVEHDLKRGHLLGISEGIPNTHIRHRVIFSIDAGVVSLVAPERTDGWKQCPLALVKKAANGCYLICIETSE